MANTQNLIHRFFNLRLSVKREIMKNIGISLNMDKSVPDFLRYKSAFIRAKEKGLIEQLAIEVEKIEQPKYREVCDYENTGDDR